MTGKTEHFGDVKVDLVEDHVEIVEMNRPRAVLTAYPLFARQVGLRLHLLRHCL